MDPYPEFGMGLLKTSYSIKQVIITFVSSKILGFTCAHARAAADDKPNHHSNE